MELHCDPLPDTFKRTGAEVLLLSAGDRIQIRKQVSGDISDILLEEVPEGRRWRASISVVVNDEPT